MPKCQLCPNPSVAYLQLFQGRKKVGSYPVCIHHGLGFLAYEKLPQDWLRDTFTKLIGIKKGEFPRIKISSKK